MGKKSKFGSVVAYGAVSVISACAGPRMAAPADVVGASDVLMVSDRSRASGALVNEGFRLGPYTVADVNRKWDSSSSLSIGPWGKETKTTGFSFTLSGSEGKLAGKCESVLKKQSVLSFGGSFDWGDTTLACSCERAEGRASLILSKGRREVAVGGSLFPLNALYAVQGGGDQSTPAGFRADADGPIGAVEVLYPGQVWLKKNLDEPTRAKLSCLFVGLMLYKPPSDD